MMRRKRRNNMTDDTSLPCRIYSGVITSGGDSHVYLVLPRHVPGRAELNFVIINPSLP
jgi:hypothetical protein